MENRNTKMNISDCLLLIYSSGQFNIAKLRDRNCWIRSQTFPGVIPCAHVHSMVLRIQVRAVACTDTPQSDRGDPNRGLGYLLFPRSIGVLVSEVSSFDFIAKSH